MTYATRIVKAHLDHFLGEGWTVKSAKLPKDKYEVELINVVTLETLVVTNENSLLDFAKKDKAVVSQVRLYFNRYPSGD